MPKLKSLFKYMNSKKSPESGKGKVIESFEKFNQFNVGGLHEQNPYGGIPMGMGANGLPNTVEQGETSFDFDDGKYIFSDRLGFDMKENMNMMSNQAAYGGLFKKKKK